MRSLQIKNLSFSYPNSSNTLFENITLEFDKGWSAIVGANGAGKSTLLKLIEKRLVPDFGVISGNDLVYYCEQSTENPPLGVEEFIESYSTESFRIKEILQIEELLYQEWKTLSHGERKRIQIGVALFLKPDVLIVDEPTNHLDKKSKEILQQSLFKFEGVGIVVSHDRAFMDSLCHNTFILKNSIFTKYKTNYSNSQIEYQKEQSHLQKVHENQQTSLKKIDTQIKSQLIKISQSKKRLSKRGLDLKDSDTREKINGARLTGKDKGDGQKLKRAQSQQEHIKEKLVGVEKSYKQGIDFVAPSKSKLFPLVIESGLLQLSESKTLIFPRVVIEQGEKIGIIGENGAGKSSFIKYLLIEKNLQQNVLYIPQELTKEEILALFEELNSLPKEVRGELYTLVTRLASNPKTLINSKNPSPGEIRKLLIANGLLKNPALIILDEPTNHMDLDSITSLEDALKEYQGGLIVISHDDVFLESFVNIKWEFQKVQSGKYRLQII